MDCFVLLYFIVFQWFYVLRTLCAESHTSTVPSCAELTATSDLRAENPPAVCTWLISALAVTPRCPESVIYDACQYCIMKSSSYSSSCYRAAETVMDYFSQEISLLHSLHSRNTV